MNFDNNNFFDIRGNRGHPMVVWLTHESTYALRSYRNYNL